MLQLLLGILNDLGRGVGGLEVETPGEIPLHSRPMKEASMPHWMDPSTESQLRPIASWGLSEMLRPADLPQLPNELLD